MFSNQAQMQSSTDNEELFFADDPTLSACCLRDLEDRKQAAIWKAELKRLDPVERAENRTRQGAGIASLFTSAPGQFRQEQPSLKLPKGKIVEISECDVSSIVSGGSFVVCLALDTGVSNLEKSVKEWLDGVDCVLVAHRFKPSTCKNCFLNENLRLPALIVWNKAEKLVVLERNRLEAETEGSLLSRIAMLKRQGGDDTDNSEDDDDRKPGRNTFFNCGKPGCDRKFHHVHVSNTWKNTAFEQDHMEDNSRDEDDDDL